MNRTGAPGSVANGCGGDTLAFKSPAFLAWRMNRPGGRLRLESGWAPHGAGSRDLHPPQSPARWHRGAWKMKPPWRRSPIRSRVSGRPQGVGSSVFRTWMVKLPGGSLRLEPGRARTRWGSGPPPSAGHDPAGRRGRSDKAVALGSTPRWPTSNHAGRSSTVDERNGGTMESKQPERIQVTPR